MEYAQTSSEFLVDRESSIEADRGESEEIQAIIDEIGADRLRDALGINESAETQSMIAAKAQAIVRVAIANILEPRKGSSPWYEAMIVAYAISYPGLAPFEATARRFGCTRQKVSKDLRILVEDMGLPTSSYQSSEEKKQLHRERNRRRRKQG